jgi:large subunit ribosomal protein L3
MKVIGQEEIGNLLLIENEAPRKSSILSSVFCRKKCMSTIITHDGRQLPVTILELVKTRLLSSDFANKKALVFVEMLGNINRPVAGLLSKYNQLNDSRFKSLIKEESDNLISKQKGKIKTVELYEKDISEISFDEFRIGDMFDISGTSKGKGFQGRIKRWGHNRRPASHGSSLDHRSGGSTGGFQNRSKTKPGVHGAGHMGCKTITVQNVQVVAIYTDVNGEKYLCVHGSVPGPNKGFLSVRRAIKYEANKH